MNALQHTLEYENHSDNHKYLRNNSFKLDLAIIFGNYLSKLIDQNIHILSYISLENDAKKVGIFAFSKSGINSVPVNYLFSYLKY